MLRQPSTITWKLVLLLANSENDIQRAKCRAKLWSSKTQVIYVSSNTWELLISTNPCRSKRSADLFLKKNKNTSKISSIRSCHQYCTYLKQNLTQNTFLPDRKKKKILDAKLQRGNRYKKQESYGGKETLIKCTPSSNLRENQYKMFYRWYITLSMITKVDKLYRSKCCKRYNNEGTFSPVCGGKTPDLLEGNQIIQNIHQNIPNALKNNIWTATVNIFIGNNSRKYIWEISRLLRSSPTVKRMSLEKRLAGGPRLEDQNWRICNNQIEISRNKFKQEIIALHVTHHPARQVERSGIQSLENEFRYPPGQ